MSNTLQFTEQQVVTCTNVKPLEGNDVAPPLVMCKEYTIIGICIDRQGNQHLDVGLKSKYNYIRSHETGEELPHGDKIHWCHPSRFEIFTH
jgi:hypothetical protein